MRHRPPSLYPVPRLAEGAVLLLEELFVVEAGDIVGRGAQLFEMSSLSAPTSGMPRQILPGLFFIRGTTFTPRTMLSSYKLCHAVKLSRAR